MATWRLIIRKEVERLDKATELYFQENLQIVGSPGVVWEAYKATIRGEIMVGEIGDERKRQEQLHQLEEEVLQLEVEFQSKQGAHAKQDLEQKGEEYKTVARVEVKTAFLAKQKRIYEVGDKAGKLLAWIGNSEREGLHKREVKMNNEDVIKGSRNIADIFAEYMATSMKQKGQPRQRR